MHRGYVLAVFMSFIHANIGGERVIIHFSDGQGRVVDTREYNAHRTIFEVSEYLKEEAERYLCSVPEHERLDGQPQVTLAWESGMFDIVADLLDERFLDCEIRTKEVVDALRLAKYLDIKDEKMGLYRNLVRAAINDRSFRAEIEAYKDEPCIKLFMLQLLREHVGLYDVNVRVLGNRATLCPEKEDMCKENWPKEKIGVVDEISIFSSAMSQLMKYNRGFLDEMRSYVHIMDIRVLEVDYIKPSVRMMSCIGNMKSLTRLSMRGDGNVLRGLSHFKGLENLTELDISENVLNARRLKKIGSLVNLTKLSMESCFSRSWSCCGLCSGGLRCIEGLDRLTELRVGRNKLKRSDILVIGDMKSLKKLDVGHCKLRRGDIKYLKDLESLEELDISESKLSKRDMQAIGEMSSLRRLWMSKCKFRSGSLEHLKDLDNLVELDISETKLSKKDMSGVGKIVNLAKLDMMLCKMQAGGLVNIKDLKKLNDLCILKIRKLNKKDKYVIDLLKQRDVRVDS